MLGLKDLLAQSCWVSKSSFEPEQMQDVREKTDPSKVPRLAQRDCLQGKTQPQRDTIPFFILLRNKKFIQVSLLSPQPWLSLISVLLRHGF